MKRVLVLATNLFVSTLCSVGSSGVAFADRTAPLQHPAPAALVQVR